MADPDRPLQFSLRWMFAVTTAVAVLLSLTALFGRWPGLIAAGCLVGYLGTRRSPSERSVPSGRRAGCLVLAVIAAVAVVALGARLIYSYRAPVLVVGGSAVLGSLLRVGRRLQARQGTVVAWFVALPIVYCVVVPSALRSLAHSVNTARTDWVFDLSVILGVFLPAVFGLMLCVRVALYGMYAGALGMAACWLALLMAVARA